jgi:hypothetical protein
MSFNTVDCGTFDCFSPITGSALTIPKGFWLPGSAAIYQGYFGTTSVLNYAMGTCNVGMSPTAPFAYTGAAGNVNFHNLSLTTYLGDHLVVGRSSTAGAELRANVANVHLVGANTTVVGGKLSMAGAVANFSGAIAKVSGALLYINGRNWDTAAAYWDSKKPFDILHPTKEGHRLRYVCLEGPEAEVYVRGKSKNNIIELPDYWVGLVDEESITVHLTPIGFSQNLYVESIRDNKIIVAGAEKYNFQYVAYGERKDVSKNITEYEGLTVADYPGDNNEYNLIR